MQRINANAFSDCINLESIVFEAESSLYLINLGAFNNCINIKSIEIPSSVIYMNKAFCNWTSEQTIYVKGFASEEEAKKVWQFDYWNDKCDANIIYIG